MAGFKRLPTREIVRMEMAKNSTKADEDLMAAIRILEGMRPTDRQEATGFKDTIAFIKDTLRSTSFRERKSDSARLRALEAGGFRITGWMQGDRLLAARDLYGIIKSGALAERLAGIPKYRHAKPVSARCMGGVSRAYLVGLENAGRSMNIILKHGNAEAEVFGARMTRAAGLLPPEVHGPWKGSDFIIVEDIHDYEGRRMRLRRFDGEKEMTIARVGVIGDEVLGCDESDVRREFWSLVGRPEGRMAFFTAWLDFMEFSRLALLCDRQHTNAAIAFASGASGSGVCILPLDLDAIAFSAGQGADGSLDLTTMESEFAHHTRHLMEVMVNCSRRAAQDGLLSSPITKAQAAASMLSALRHRKASGVPADYASLRLRVLRELGSHAKMGTRFGAKTAASHVRGRLGSRKAARLADAIRRISSPGGRAAFIEKHMEAVRQFRQ